MATKINRSLLTKTHRHILDQNKGRPPPWMLHMVRQKTKDLKRLTEPGANFLVGQKKVYLPDFTVAMMRTPHLPPTHAQFRVPLNFTKLDIRDYLFHAYSVRVHSVRTVLTGFKIRPGGKNPEPRMLLRKIKELGLRKPSKRLKKQIVQARNREFAPWDRQKVRKMMIVHLEKPFVWPPMLDEEALDKLAGPAMRHLRTMERKNRELEPTGGRDLEAESESERWLEKQAAALAEGRSSWRGPPKLPTVEDEARMATTKALLLGKGGKSKHVSAAGSETSLAKKPKRVRTRNKMLKEA